MGEEKAPTDRPDEDPEEGSTRTHAADEQTVDRYLVGVDSSSAVVDVDRHATAVVRQFETSTFGSAVVCEATADDVAALESCAAVQFVAQDRPRYPVVVG